jgi:hypothetical protein
MKRRQILGSWYWLLSLGGSREMSNSEIVCANPPVSKNSTPSEVSEIARALAREFSGGLTPITNPNEGERCEQTHHRERRSPNVE